MPANINELIYLGLIFGLLVFPRALQRYRIPAPLTCLIFGIIAAYFFNITSDSTLSLLAIIGISSLFLFAGLDIDFKQLSQNALPLFFYLLVTLLLLAISIVISMHFFDFRWQTATLLGLALLIPSTGFIMESLSSLDLSADEKQWITQKSIASELVALAILFVVLQADSAAVLAISTLQLLAIAIVLPLLFITLSKIILPHAPGSEFSLLIMTGIIAAYFTKHIGVYYLVGAFITGIIARQLRNRLPELASDENLHAVKLFASFFIPFYFFYSGMRIPDSALQPKALLLGIGLTIIILPCRFSIIWLQRYLSTKESHLNRKNISAALSPTLIFTLVIAGIMHNRHTIGDVLYGALIVYACISTLLPSFFMKRKSSTTTNGNIAMNTNSGEKTSSNNTSTENSSTENKEDILGFMKDHIKRYLATNGEDGHLMNGFPCLVLTTTGKKSGEKRQAAVIYGKHNNSYVIVASKGGSDTPPAWFVNLQANPRAHIQVKEKKMDVQMRVAEGVEHKLLWEMMAKVFPDYLEYQKKTARKIPVVILDPV